MTTKRMAAAVSTSVCASANTNVRKSASTSVKKSVSMKKTMAVAVKKTMAAVVKKTTVAVVKNHLIAVKITVAVTNAAAVVNQKTKAPLLDCRGAFLVYIYRIKATRVSCSRCCVNLNKNEIILKTSLLCFRLTIYFKLDMGWMNENFSLESKSGIWN